MCSLVRTPIATKSAGVPTPFFAPVVSFGPDSLRGSHTEDTLFHCLKKLFSNLTNDYEALLKNVCHLVSFLKLSL